MPRNRKYLITGLTMAAAAFLSSCACNPEANNYVCTDIWNDCLDDVEAEFEHCYANTIPGSDAMMGCYRFYELAINSCEVGYWDCRYACR